jgi:hypothetical protein
MRQSLKLAFWLQVKVDALPHSILFYMKNKAHILFSDEKKNQKLQSTDDT